MGGSVRPRQLAAGMLVAAASHVCTDRAQRLGLARLVLTKPVLCGVVSTRCAVCGVIIDLLMKLL